MVLAILTLISGVSFAEPLRSDNFITPIECQGSSLALENSEKAEITFNFNSVYEESERAVFNVHTVKVTTTSFGIWSSSNTYSHLNMNRDCYKKENLVTCSGIGVGTGTQEFEVTIDLSSMTAIGELRMTPYSNSDYNRTYKFGSENPLICR